MIKNLINLSFTQTGKDTTIVFWGTLVNVIIGGLFFILVPRILGPQVYGLFSVVMATGLMAVNFANFGIDTGILRFIKPQDKKTNDKILKLALKAYVTIGIGVFLLGLLVSAPIANFLDAPQVSGLLRIAFSGTIFILLSNFFVAVLQSRKEFIKASMVTITSNVARLSILAIASYFITIDLYFLTILFFFVTITSVFLGKFFVSFDFLKAKDEKPQFKKFFSYNFWIAVSLAISAIPIDNYILVKIAGPFATGLFAAPMKILTTTYQFAGSFSRVLASRFSSFDTDQKALEFSKKASVFVALVFTVLIISGFFADPFIKIILGDEFTQSIPVFRILAIGMAFFFADTIPMALILYYFGKSQIAFFITVLHYFIYAILLFLLVSNYSSIGAALAFTVSEIITFIVLVGYVFFKFKIR